MSGLDSAIGDSLPVSLVQGAASRAYLPDNLAAGLYIVATPIGNLGDITARAVALLHRADVVAVEDSRVSGKLLARWGIETPMSVYHDHSPPHVRARLVASMEDKIVALLCDGGTPLISDPGYKLVQAARAAGRYVTSLPGPCAAIAALTMAGLPTDRFLFAGFLPSKAKARDAAIAELAGVRATLIFYESGRRLAQSLLALAAGLDGEAEATAPTRANRTAPRQAAVVREISKFYEDCRLGSLAELAAHYAARPPKGEIVIIVAPPDKHDRPDTRGDHARADSNDIKSGNFEQADIDQAIRSALLHQTAAQVAKDLARQFGLERKALYQHILSLQGRRGDARRRGAENSGE